MAEEKKIKNIYQKMAQAQYEFSMLNIKKTGDNKGLKFKYFELSDITPPLLKICYDLGLYINTRVERNGDFFEGVITVINADNPEESVETSCSLRPTDVRTSATQQDGAIITYARRYLLMLMFNIVEPDTLDAQGANDISYADNVRAKNPPRPRENRNDSKPMIPNPSSAWGELMKFFGWTGNNVELDRDASSRAHDTIEAMEIHIKSPMELTQQNAEDIRKWMAENPDFRHLSGPESFDGDDISEMETRK